MTCRHCKNEARMGLKTCADCGLRNSQNCKAWRKNNPEAWKELHRVLYIRRHLRLFSGKIEPEEWTKLLMLYGDRCIACGKHKTELETLGRMLVPDHVIPLVAGGANTIGNIQPLCHSVKLGARGCNSMKGKQHTDYRPSQAARHLEQARDTIVSTGAK